MLMINDMDNGAYLEPYTWSRSLCRSISNSTKRKGVGFTHFPIPCSWVTCVQSSDKYSLENCWIIVALFLCNPKLCITLAILMLSALTAASALGHTLKKSDNTCLTYNKAINICWRNSILDLQHEIVTLDYILRSTDSTPHTISHEWNGITHNQR